MDGRERQQLVEALDALGPRPAGSDAERLAALQLAAALEAGGRRSVAVEPVWVRPRWELAWALYAALGVLGSVLAVSTPAAGVAAAAAALLALALDARGWFLLRWLTPQRATQNVVAAAPAGRDRSGRAGTASGPSAAIVGDSATSGDSATARDPSAASSPATRVNLTAHCDTPRGGLLRSRALGRLGRGRIGAAAWIALALLAVGACAAARAAGASGSAIGVVQLVPTIGLLLALGLLVDGALARPAAPTGEASAAAAVVAVAHALDVAPPRRLAVDVVVAGAGTGQALGFLAHLRARRPARERTIVVEVSSCAAGPPRWWTADAALLPLRFDPRLGALAAQVADEERQLDARPYRGRGLGGALRARQRRLPAIRVGCAPVARRGSANGAAGTPPDPAAMTATVELTLALIHALDAELAAG